MSTYFYCHPPIPGTELGPRLKVYGIEVERTQGDKHETFQLSDGQNFIHCWPHDEVHVFARYGPNFPGDILEIVRLEFGVQLLSEHGWNVPHPPPATLVETILRAVLSEDPCRARDLCEHLKGKVLVGEIVKDSESGIIGRLLGIEYPLVYPGFSLQKTASTPYSQPGLGGPALAVIANPQDGWTTVRPFEWPPGFKWPTEGKDSGDHHRKAVSHASAPRNLTSSIPVHICPLSQVVRVRVSVD